MKKSPLLSVIIPMYGVERFLPTCLESIINQSYKNLEILCVDDGSPDKCAKIAEEYANKDERVKVIYNPSNLGLFRARVAGLEIAKGDYIAFVDADDYVSIDWFRLLMKKIGEEDADMVIGNTVSIDEINENDRYYYNSIYASLNQSMQTLRKDELLKSFYLQEGSCFSWHTVWNKVYKKELVDRCLPYFKKIDFNLIMGEDIAFSSVFYTHANSLAFANADCYFYIRHAAASTSTTLPKEKVLRNVRDMKAVFEFVKSSLNEYDSELYNEYLPLIERFKSRYHRIWCGNVGAAGLGGDKEAQALLCEAFDKEEAVYPYPYEFYFYSLTTDWSGRMEGIKKALYDPKIKIVSFDIFDTLIKRPFYDPADVLYFVGKEASRLHSHINEKTFVKLRRSAEEKARNYSKERNPKYQDVTLTEIYSAFAKEAGISHEDAMEIRDIENATEIKYCMQRKSAKEIFDLALLFGKRVVIISDMYLERDTIEKILHKNGYEGYEALYLSSEERLLKSTGDLFKLASKELDFKKGEAVHIGDNWNSDIINASENGFETIFFPKATETFENKISDIYTGNGATPFTTLLATKDKPLASMEQLPLRCALATAVNNAFDYPFTIFQSNSSYNGDTYLMGYTTLGMHVLGIAEWILDEAKKNGYKKIVFLARDGKMVKKAFDMLCQARNEDIKSDYFYATRKALMPYSIKEAKDLYSLEAFIDVREHTPLHLMELISTVLKPLSENDKTLYKQRGIELEERFRNYGEFYSFISALIDISFDESLCRHNFAVASEAFKNVFGENTATFDLGYSGRLQSIICDLAQRSIDTFFIHTNGYNTDINVQDRFKIYSYYDHTPTISGIIREYFMSDPTPSCYGYKFDGGIITPLIEETTDSLSYESTFAVCQMQKGALDYVKDYLDIFGELVDFKARNSDYAIAFDYMLLNSPEFDRYAFSNAMIEDTVYSGYEARSVFETWTWHLAQLKGQSVVDNTSFAFTLEGSKWKKAIVYLLYDRKTFKEKMNKKLEKRRLIRWFCKVIYGFFRGIYRIFKRIFRRRKKK